MIQICALLLANQLLGVVSKMTINQSVKSQRTKIGIKAIEAMQPHSIVWDEKIPGFNARRQFSTVVTFSIVYRTLGNVQRWQRIGRYGVWTPDQARHEAQRVLRARDLGEDPAGARLALRNSMTMAELCDEYSARENGKKPATIKADNSRIKLHIKPKLGRLKVVSVTSEQIEDFMHSLSQGSQGRVVGLLGAIFSYAVKRKLVTVNPVREVEKPKEVKRNRRLSEAEYAQLGAALKGDMVSDIFQLLAVTGFRSSEVKNLRWSELDLDRSIVTLGDTKTGVSVRPLSDAAIAIIKRQKKNGSEYVFDYEHGKPIGNLRSRWLKLNMDGTIVPHVLRHSFASLAADLGLADSTIAGLIGHKQQSITSRYLHLDKALISAANIVAVETLKLMRLGKI
jgi:site-specific recombinase XerD